MKDPLINPNLAIVVPAYKGDFLGKALACLARQTDQRFNIYIYNDASPADIEGIARPVLGGRSYTYKRFEENMGGVSLMQHWNRCVALTSEPWIWLFSDDDLMDETCVEEFNKFLETGNSLADIVRFDTWVVDEQDRIIDLHTQHVEAESGWEYAYFYLMGLRRSVTQQLVFRRIALEQAGGFLDLPLGWGTDNATIIALGRHQKIRRIPRARVSWRKSRQNLTPDGSFKMRREKLRASCLFLQWLKRQLDAPREHLFADDDLAFQNAMDRFLMEQIGNEGSRAALANWRLLTNTRAEVCGGSRLPLFKFIAIAAAADSISATAQFAKALGSKR